MRFRKAIEDGLNNTVAVPSRTAVTISGFALVIGIAALIVAVAALVRH